MDTTFVVHVGDPFEIAPLVLVGCGAEGTPSEITIEALSHERNTVITYDLRTLVDASQVKGLTLPGKIVEMKDALRLIAGLSRVQGGEKSWDWWSYISPAAMPIEDVGRLKNVIEGKVPRPSHKDLVRILMDTAKVLRVIWEETLTELVNR